MFNIILATQARISGTLVDRVAEKSGEDPQRTRSAITASVYAAAAGFIRRASTREGSLALLAELRSDAPSVRLLGSHADELRGVVAHASGVSGRTASAALAAVTPIAAHVLGHEVSVRGLNEGGVTTLLLAQRESLVATPVLPSGLSSFLQTPPRDGAPVRAPASVRTPASVPRPSHSLFPVAMIGLALLVAVLVLLGRSRAPALGPDAPSSDVDQAVREPVVPPAPVPALPVPEPVSTTTLTGAELERTDAPEPPRAPMK